MVIFSECNLQPVSKPPVHTSGFDSMNGLIPKMSDMNTRLVENKIIEVSRLG